MADKISRFGLIVEWTINAGGRCSAHERYDLVGEDAEFFDGLPASGIGFAHDADISIASAINVMLRRCVEAKKMDVPYVKRRKLIYDLELEKTKRGIIEDFLAAETVSRLRGINGNQNSAGSLAGNNGGDPGAVGEEPPLLSAADEF